MLHTLRVADLAIIDTMELGFAPGLNVLTGETGAGKSILLQALDVALGGRSDVDLIRSGAEEAVVEALFGAPSPAVHELLSVAGVRLRTDEDELVVRRVVGRGGRARAYVNGSLATVALLRDLAPHCVRVYGQHEHQALRRIESHRELLDAVAGLGTGVAEMAQRHHRLQVAKEALSERRAAQASATARIELLQFQAGELERAALVAGEDEAFAIERNRLVHADRLAQLVGAAEGGLYSGEGAATDQLGQALTALREAERVDPALGESRTLVETALAEIEEAGAALGRYARALAPDPERLAVVDARLAELGRLKRKYGGSVDDLIRRRDELASELAVVSEGADGLDGLAAEVDAAQQAAAEWAKRLSVERRRAASQLDRAMAAELGALALDGAQFAVRFGEPGSRPVGPSGWDEVEFHLSANAGEELRPLARVASGGELSRIMLALKSLAAADDRGATLVFDEVDAGIGGTAAEVVARKLHQLGRRRQVLCVTHLPVIAAFADHHIAVEKHVADGRTLSTARPLSSTDRVAELARMLGGTRLTREAREHAAALLRQAGAAGRGAES